MRDIIINKTEREGLLYLLFQDLKYKFGKFLNLHNFILRKKRISNFLNQNDKINIQFGAGSGKFGEAKKTVLGTFLNTDIFGKIPVDINYSLPFPNNSIDLIFSSHLIEHIYQRKADLFFQESLRILKEDGQLIIATPTINKIFDILYKSNKKQTNEIFEEHKNSFLGRKPTPARLINALTHINYGHKFLFDYETLNDLAVSNGFKSFETKNPKNIDNLEIKQYLESKNSNFKLQTEVFVAYK